MTPQSRSSASDDEAHSPLLGRSESPPVGRMFERARSKPQRHHRRRTSTSGQWSGLAWDVFYFLVRQRWFPTRPVTILATLVGLGVAITGLTFSIIYFINSFKTALPWRNYCLETAPFPPANYTTLPPVGVFLGVLTVAAGYERRMMIRETYAAHPASRISGTERTVVRFIMGRPSKEYESAVALEMDIHNDIVILPIKENMNDGKSFAYFQWAYHNAFVPPPPGLPELNNRTVTLASHDPRGVSARGWIPPDYVLKVDDDSFVMLGEIEARLRVTPRSMLYWGYVVKKKFIGGESYALSWDLVQYVATAKQLLSMTRGEEDQVTARWMKAHPRAHEILWWNERCWIYDHPKASTVYSHGFLFPSEVHRVREFAAQQAKRLADGAGSVDEDGQPPADDSVIPLEDDPRADPRHSSVATFRHRYEYNVASHWPTRYRPPRTNLTLEQSMEALVEGSGMSMIAPGADAQKVWDARERWSDKYRGSSVGGSVVVHYVKKREWWLECVEIMLGSKGIGMRPDGGGGGHAGGVVGEWEVEGR
ncbi:hypothetical protein RhiJN_01818 [Ceratobasidium sp. AG-Ba]|nr:hypothetical protein RhiJN_01818 [Ceratobasidium sp. AG-Ba]QRW02753.1 hypothetical protein RhiLY_01752 [Ceratobasidium sp. AG-Ba]